MSLFNNWTTEDHGVIFEHNASSWVLQPGVLKGVISVTFGFFWPLSQWNVLKGGCCHDSLASNLSLSGWCLPLSLPLYLRGHSILFHGGISSMFHGGLSSTVVVSHGDLSSIYGGWSGCLEVTIPFCLHRLLGCLQLGWDLAGASVALGWSASAFSEMKRETSFSTMSYFIFLALTQSSKVLKWTLLVLYLISWVLKGVKFLLTFFPDLPMVLKWVSLMFFSPLTHIPFIWRVLKGVSNSVAKSSSDDLWSEMTKFSSLYVHNGLEMGSWKELILHSLCPFQYEGLEHGVLEGVKFASFPSMPEPLMCSDLLPGYLQGTLPSISTIWLRMLGFTSVAVMDVAMFL